jgi:hypothetical protein
MCPLTNSRKSSRNCWRSEGVDRRDGALWLSVPRAIADRRGWWYGVTEQYLDLRLAGLSAWQFRNLSSFESVTCSDATAL